MKLSQQRRGAIWQPGASPVHGSSLRWGTMGVASHLPDTGFLKGVFTDTGVDFRGLSSTPAS